MCGVKTCAATLLAQLVADEVLQLLADDRAVGRPEDEALADVFVDVEEFQFLAELAVVAGLGLLLSWSRYWSSSSRVGKAVP